MTLRPALKYNGAKWILAPRIISRFPAHNTYCEPFGGSGAVLIQKPAAKYEVFNDLDGNVFNFFTQLRNHTKELVRAVKFTAYSRKEFELCLESSPDPLEQARRFYCRCWMSISYNNLRGTGWRILPFNKTGGHVPQILFGKTSHLLKIARRFKEVQIESVDFEKVIATCDSTETLFYVDPPYPGFSERLYNVQFTTADYIRLLGALTRAKGTVILSGYEDYGLLLPGQITEAMQHWKTVRLDTRNRARAKRTECLFIKEAA